MTTYLIRRLLWMIPTSSWSRWSRLSSCATRPAAPGIVDSDRRQVDAATQKSLNAYYGLDKPLWRQFIAYTIGDFNKKGAFICGAICGNLGPSYRTAGATVQDILFSPPEGKPFWYSRFGYSMRLGFIALCLRSLSASRSA